LSFVPSKVTGHVVTFTVADEKKFVCNRLIADTAIFQHNKPFVVQLEGLDPTGLYENFPAITFYSLKLSGMRKARQLLIDSLRGHGAFGTVEGRGSVVGEVLDCHFTINLKTQFIEKLSFVRENEIDPERPEYVISVDLQGTIRSPHITVTSELFQFSLKKNV